MLNCGSTMPNGSEIRASSGTEEGSTASSDEDNPRRMAARPRVILRSSATGAGAGAGAGQPASSGGMAGKAGGGKPGRAAGGAKDCGTGLTEGGGGGEERKTGLAGSASPLFCRTVTGLGCTGTEGGGITGERDDGAAVGLAGERSEIGGIWMRWVFLLTWCEGDVAPAGSGGIDVAMRCVAEGGRSWLSTGGTPNGTAGAGGTAGPGVSEMRLGTVGPLSRILPPATEARTVEGGRLLGVDGTGGLRGGRGRHGHRLDWGSLGAEIV